MNSKPQPSNSRSKQSWGEIQLAIAAVGLTATLIFWNLFSAPRKQQDVVAQVVDDTLPSTQEPTQMPTPALAFRPVKIIFGGVAPQQRVVVVQGAAPAQPKRRSGGGAPQPAANTGSSKP